MTVKIYKSITEVDEAKWDAIIGNGGIICSYKYLELMEKSGVNEGRCYYVVVYEGDEIMAHTFAYLTETELDIFAQGVLKKVVDLIRRTWKGFLMLKYLECGSPDAMGNPISVREGANHAEALKLICSELENLAKELGAKMILFRDIYDEETKFHDSFNSLGYKKIHNLPKAKIIVRWKSFDEYMDSMRSSYRCKITKAMKICSGADISIRELKDFSVRYAHDMKRLHDNTNMRAKEIKREPLPEAFFQNLDKYLGEKGLVAFAVKDSKPIGFMLLLVNDKELVSSAVGLDYDYNERLGIYFNLFYKAIERGIAMGMDEIGMGITTLDPKKNMGSVVVNLNMYMKYFNPFLNKVIPVIFDMITPPDTTGPRNVFKEGPK